jgi:hypothetical protein
MATDVQPHRFSIEQYERMVEAGVLTENDRVELIDGQIVEMPPIDPQHSFPVQKLASIFHRVLAEKVAIRVRDPIRLPPDSEPEPDIVLVIGPHRRYVARHPEPSDILLVVEVAYTTKRFDADTKLPMYARAGIAEVWLVDVPAHRIEVYRDPTGTTYGFSEVATTRGSIACAAFPDVLIRVDDVIP